MAKQTDGINGGYRGTVGTVVGYMWRGQWCLRAKPRFYHDAKTDEQLAHRALFKATVAFAGHIKEVLHLGLKVPAYKAHKTECNYFLKINKGCFRIENGELRTENVATQVAESVLSPVPSLQGGVANGRGGGKREADNAALIVDYPSLKLSEGPVAPVDFFGVTPTPPYGHPSLQGGDAAAANLSPLNSRPLSPRGVAEGRGVHPPLILPFDKNPEHRRADASDLVYVAALCGDEVELSNPVYRRMGSVSLMLPERWAEKEVHLYGFVVDSEGRASDSCYIGEVSELVSQTEMSQQASLPDETKEDTQARVPAYQESAPEAESQRSEGNARSVP